MKKYTQLNPKYGYKVVKADNDEIGFDVTESEFSGKAIDRFYDLEHGIESLIEDLETSIAIGEDILEYQKANNIKDQEYTKEVNGVIRRILERLEKITGD